MFQFLTIDHFNLTKKTVGVRVDINSPIINGKIVLSERIKKSAVTIRELSDCGAKQIILAHQGRKGKPDCVSFKNHLPLLEKEVGKKIKFVSQVYSKNVVKEIQNLKEGGILLLENLRFLDDETNLNKKENKILKLEKHFDFYVFDAFSVAHREQTSVVGFRNIPNIAGRQMEHEILSLNLIEDSPNPHSYLFGGSKADDLVPLIEKGLKTKSVSFVLLTGVIGEVALLSKGYYLGGKEKFLKENGFLSVKPKITELLKKYPHNIFVPKDVALINDKKRVEIRVEDLKKNKDLLEKNLIEDVGEETIKYFSKLLERAGSIYVKGTPGNFEEKGLERGTKGLFKTVVSSNAFTFMGGGHSVTAASMFHDLKKFSYVSLAGGALVKFLTGEELAGVQTLVRSYSKYRKEISDFSVVGSNVSDTYLNVNEPLSEISVGEKIRLKQNFKETVGGGGINTSIAISRLGGMVSYLGKISQEFEEKLKKELSRNCVSLIESKLSKRPVAKSIIVDTRDNDRVIFSYCGQNSCLELRDFDIHDIKSKHIYFSALSNTSFETQYFIARKLKKLTKKTLICYNPSSYITRNEKNSKNLLNYIDIVILNYDEAQELTKKERMNECLNSLKEKVSKVVVITDGKNGSYAYDGKKHYFQKAFVPKNVIDTTGAGDCFASTFFYFCVKGFSIKQSLKYAALNASSVVTKKGPVDGLLYYDDLVKSKD